MLSMRMYFWDAWPTDGVTGPTPGSFMLLGVGRCVLLPLLFLLLFA